MPLAPSQPNRHPKVNTFPRKTTSISIAAFTLIELLVVISIIALLISILLPALKAARQSAQAVTCLSQQRQFGIAMATYANEHDGTVPEARDGGNAWVNNWQWKMAPYLGYPRAPYWKRPKPIFPLYLDPVRVDEANIPNTQAIKTNYRYNYSMGNRGLAGWQFPATAPAMAPKKLANFARPGSAIALVDGNLNRNLNAPDFFSQFGWNNIRTDDHAVDVGRHRGSENYLYVDGHAAPGHLKNIEKDQVSLTADHKIYRW